MPALHFPTNSNACQTLLVKFSKLKAPKDKDFVHLNLRGRTLTCNLIMKAAVEMVKMDMLQ